MRNLKILLSASALSVASVCMIPAARAQVTGVTGCVLKPGQDDSIMFTSGAGSEGGSTTEQPVRCPDQERVSTGRADTVENPWVMDTFATAGSVNTEIGKLQSAIDQLAGGTATGVTTDGTTITGDGTAASPVKLADGLQNTINSHTTSINNINTKNTAQDQALNDHEQRITANTTKNTAQDTRLAGHDTAITNINVKNAAQDATLNNHEQRITKNEGDIANINTVNNAQDQTLNDHEQRITANTTKNSEQDIRLTGIDAKNTEQDATLGDHEQRIITNEGDIKDIEDGAVFYNRDGTGTKTGGVTFNDGTGTAVRLGNVAAGVETTDAVNVGQLTGALNGLGGGAAVNPGGSVTGPTYNVGGATYTNVADALRSSNQLAVQYLPDAAGKPTNIVALTGDGTGAPVKITNLAAGTNDADAVNLGQVKNNIAYDTNPDGTRGNSVTLKGGADAPVLISNVADGVVNSDAATLGQVKKAKADSYKYTDEKFGELQDHTDNRINNLSGDIRSVRKEARSGIASATAMAGLRFDDRPGKASIAAGIGGFKSATSIATGVGYTTEDGRFRLNGSLGYGFEDQSVSWNTGASWTFN